MVTPPGDAGRSPAFDLARRDDIPDLIRIDASSATPWTHTAFEGELDHEPSTLFVLREGDRVVAFVAVRIQGPDMDIVNIAVAPERRRLGLGRALILRLLESPLAHGVEEVFLEVRAGNEAALALYARMGFKETQRRRGFYRDPQEDAVLMTLKLSHQDG